MRAGGVALTASPTLHHIALGARDPERLAAFYRDTLGLPQLTQHLADDGVVRSVWLDLGGAILMIERIPIETAPVPQTDDDKHPGPFLIAVRVAADERKEWCARLEAAGAPVESETAWTSYVRDPEGNRVAVSSYEG